MLRLGTLVLTCCALLAPASAQAVDNPNVPGSDWTQAQIDSPDFALDQALPTTIKLHADILRPKGLKDTDKTPVIVSVGPYFNHSGQESAIGADYDPTGPVDHPSARFDDFVNGAKLMQKGYTFVMVDLRGFGGSGGCLDWGGNGEQADVTAAVEWAAKQPWSNGNVGLYGKSYDGVTGLMGVVNEPKGLKAVVSMEPVYDLYRYLYSDGVRYSNSLLTPALYDAISSTPGPLSDDVTYNINAFNLPHCAVTNYATQQDANHQSSFWKLRDFIGKAKGKTTPLFLTQGFLENNTKPDGSFDFFNNLAGTHNRAWFGMWDHVRGNEVDAKGRLVEGRAGFFDEVMRFYDRHLKGDTTADPDADPRIVVQTSDGSWRAEQSWPPADSTPLTTTLKTGTYEGDGQNDGTGEFAGNGLWTISPPLAHDAWYAGVPHASLKVTPDPTSVNPQVVVDTYDINAAGKAILLSRNATLIPGDGKVETDLYGNDWKIGAGHRLGVLVTDTNSEWWLPTQGTTFTLDSGTVTLPFLAGERPATIQGDPSVRLEAWLKDAPFTIPAATITGNTVAAFALPAPLVAAAATPTATPTPGPGTTTDPQPTATATASPVSQDTGPSATPAPTATPVGSLVPAPKLRSYIRLRLRKRPHINVGGRTFATSKVTVRLFRNGTRIKTRKVTITGHFRVKFFVYRPGRYHAVVLARSADGTQSRITRKVHYRR